MTRFGLMGAAIGIGNRGVSALGVSTVNLVHEARADAAVSLLIGNRHADSRKVRLPDRTIEVPIVNYRMSPKAPLGIQLWWILVFSVIYRLLPLGFVRSAIKKRNTWIRTAADAAVVADIRGGDSFSDIYGLQRFVIGSLPLLAVLLVRRRVVLLPQTYGPYKSSWARRLARFILQRTSLIVSRDRESLKVIEDLIGPADRVRFCPDVAFSMMPIRPEKPAIEPPLPSTAPACLVGINVNGLMFNGGYNRANMFGLKLDYHAFLEKLVSQLLAKPGVHVLLVPHTFAPAGRVESDPEACRTILKSVPAAYADRVHLVTAEYDQNEIKGVVGLCDFFVGSRMHACIAALSQGIPAVGVAYSRKFVGVFETVGAGEWIVDGRDSDAESGVARVMDLYTQREQLRPVLQQRVREARAQLSKTFQEILATAER